MPNYLVLPPKGGAVITTKTHSGQSYTAAAGSNVTVPAYDAFNLSANGWVLVAETGTTAARPAAPGRGKLYYDTTISKFVMHDGGVWRDPTTGSAA